ncbi:MAG: hypothetical protein F2603_02285 [Actinobacteria bacterium]|nr:hypothetical protein [Actinomycetota bacterium]
MGLNPTSAILTSQFSAAREHFAVHAKRELTEDLLDEFSTFRSSKHFKPERVLLNA